MDTMTPSEQETTAAPLDVLIARCIARGGGASDTEPAQVPKDGATTAKGEAEESITPRSVEPLEEVIKHPIPTNAEHGLAAVPLVRHWLFAPDGTKLRHRDISVRTVHKGVDVLQQIRVGDRFALPGTGYGVLKARHQRLLFAVQDLWQRQGGKLARVDGARRGVVCASSRDFEARLFGSHGGQQQRIVRALIQQIASIPVEITNYIGRDGQIYDLDITGLLAGAKFLRTRRGGQRGTPWVEIYLSSVITQAFEENAIKPVNLHVLNSFRSDFTALLYPKIDYYLSANRETEIRLDGLTEKMGLSDKRLRQPMYRRRKFETVVKELHGRPISTDDYVIDANLVPTSDGRDHKIVASRTRARKI